MRLTVVGNPGNRRVALFQAAVVAAGLPPATVVDWRSLAAGAVTLPPHSLVRVDSPGEDAEVDRLLRGITLTHGEIGGARQWYEGFRAALARLSEAAETAPARLVNDPAEILTMFDKAACHARLSALGIPVPAALPDPVVGWASLRDALDEAGWRRVFVKPRHSSSASGVLALQFDGGGRVRATTSVEIDGGRLFNSLRLRTYERAADVAAIVDRLAPDGLHVERWFPKAGLGGRTVDARVVVVDGRPTHAVVRGSHGPITNLHLGAVRGDLEALRAAAGPQFAAAMDTCARVGAAFPASLQVGVDLMFAADWRRHAVAEVNAFGDLLPGLLVDGRDTYAVQVEALARRAVAHA